MTKIVINRCHGGFGLSDEAVERYAQIKSINLGPRQNASFRSAHWYVDGVEDNEHYFSSHSIERRDDAALVQVVEEMADAASGNYAELAVVEIPDNVEWHIGEYDGIEHVAENHRTWY